MKPLTFLLFFLLVSCTTQEANKTPFSFAALNDAEKISYLKRNAHDIDTETLLGWYETEDGFSVKETIIENLQNRERVTIDGITYAHPQLYLWKIEQEPQLKKLLALSAGKINDNGWLAFAHLISTQPRFFSSFIEGSPHLRSVSSDTTTFTVVKIGHKGYLYANEQGETNVYHLGSSLKDATWSDSGDAYADLLLYYLFIETEPEDEPIVLDDIFPQHGYSPGQFWLQRHGPSGITYVKVVRPGKGTHFIFLQSLREQPGKKENWYYGYDQFQEALADVFIYRTLMEGGLHTLTLGPEYAVPVSRHGWSYQKVYEDGKDWIKATKGNDALFAVPESLIQYPGNKENWK